MRAECIFSSNISMASYIRRRMSSHFDIAHLIEVNLTSDDPAVRLVANAIEEPSHWKLACLACTVRHSSAQCRGAHISVHDLANGCTS